MLTFKKKLDYIYFFIGLILVLGISSGNVLAWENPITIAGQGDHRYYKPEIGFAPSGAVYITYRDKEMAGGNSDIILCMYDGKEMVYENVSEGVNFYPKFKCYESDVDVTPDGRIHVAWVMHDRNAAATHFVQYRYKDGSVWSEIFDLGQLPMPNEDVAFDLRLGVSENGNVNVVTYREHAVDIWFFAKYGDTILPVQSVGNPGSRKKHPDIAVDDNYVHLLWMRKVGFPYVLMYQKRENRLGGTKGEIQQVTFPQEPWASQKSRIDVGSDGLFHMVEFKKQGTIKKLNYYKELSNGSISDNTTVSHPSDLKLYHWADLEVRDNSIICIMQLGSSSGGNGIWHSWQKNGVWGEYLPIPGTAGVIHDSVDLSPDGEIAAVAYQEFDTAIKMVSSAEITATGTLETEFTHPATVFWGDTVTFDATQCAGLNPDHNIVSYEWDFGDGNIETTTSPAITHNFDTYGTDVQVTLKIMAETGEEGTFEKDMHIHALYNGIITNVEEKRILTLFFNRPANEIQWMDNPKNEAAGYPAVTRYEIWRAPVSSIMSDNAYSLIAEVDPSVTRFLDYQGVQANVNYVYSIRSVDVEGHISPFDNQ
jgi:hypothetical protein